MKKQIIFSHGKESGPEGTKILALIAVAKEMGYKVLSIDYRKCADVNERVNLLEKTISKMESDELILVGSSMGGYVSLAVANEIQVDGLFLMCPALYLPNYEIQSFSPRTDKIEITHAWQDDIVPYENSIKFAKENKAILHLVEDNHRLSESLLFLAQSFWFFLERE
ncbi:MAG: YqiA/YcfP family alpha/beta fold hydrolase [Saprospiraceae bacterium]